MRLSISIVVVLFIGLAALSSPCRATTLGGKILNCPACGQRFTAMLTGSYSALGDDVEGRPICSGMDIQEFRLHSCPHCHYSGFVSNFEEKGDIPVGQVMQRVRDDLARNAASLPPGALWPLERVRATEVCYQASGAAAWQFESLYRIGAWLADDAGEDALALEYRNKSLEALVRAASVSEQTGAHYANGMHALWTGEFAQAVTSLKSARAGLEAETTAFEKQWTPHRDEILRRLKVKNTDPADPVVPAATKPAEKIDERELDWDSIIDEAKPNELPLVHRRLLIFEMDARLDSMGQIAELRALGEPTARQRVLAGGLALRATYISAFGRRADAKQRSLIREVIDAPMPPTTPPSEPDDSSKSWLTNFWDHVSPGAPGLDNPAMDINKLSRQLKESRDQNNSPFETIKDLAEMRSREAAGVLLADLVAHTDTYIDDFFPLTTDAKADAWKVMAMDEARAMYIASGQLAKNPQSPNEKALTRLALRPLAFVSDEKSLAILKAALSHGDTEVRAEAAKCLICRGKHEGVAAFILVAAEDDDQLVKFDPSLAAAFVSLILPEDIPALLKLESKWPGPIKRKNDDRKAMSAVTIRAALAKADATKFLADYEKAIDELLASPIEGQNPARVPWEDTVPESMELLGWCGNLYYIPHIDKQLGPMLATGVTEYGVATAIDMLTRAEIEDEDDALALQIKRPVPLMVKYALIHATGRLHIDGRESAMARWAKSDNEGLAEEARKAIQSPVNRP